MSLLSLQSLLQRGVRPRFPFPKMNQQFPQFQPGVSYLQGASPYRRSSHSKDKPYKCEHEGCSASFYYNSHLRAHETQKHGRIPKARRSFPIPKGLFVSVTNSSPQVQQPAQPAASDPCVGMEEATTASPITTNEDPGVSPPSDGAESGGEGAAHEPSDSSQDFNTGTKGEQE